MIQLMIFQRQSYNVKIACSDYMIAAMAQSKPAIFRFIDVRDPSKCSWYCHSTIETYKWNWEGSWNTSVWTTVPKLTNWGIKTKTDLCHTYNFSRYRLHVFRRLAPFACFLNCFPNCGIKTKTDLCYTYVFSHYRLHFFPQLAPFACFSALGASLTVFRA